MKGSMMGSSKYEYHPEQFDIDVKNKVEFIDNTTKEVEELLKKRAVQYNEKLQGRPDFFIEDVMKRLVKNQLARRG